MAFWDKYNAARAQKRTPLCIGLDTAVDSIPSHLRQQTKSAAITEFNRRIIDATHEFAIAYKINLAFYEQYGSEGWSAFEKTLAMIPPECLCIADAKRGDIGNTSKAYARAFFEQYPCDAITVQPYMGQDSVAPFLEYAHKMTFVLALTSNAGSFDFQRLLTGNNKPLYKTVVQTCLAWAEGKNNCGFVVGATHAQELADLRMIIPQDTILLIPGVGAQGGDLSATLRANGNAPALINVSRGILYASHDRDFAQAARLAAMRFNAEVREVAESALASSPSK